jgi:hypothetical protein
MGLIISNPTCFEFVDQCYKIATAATSHVEATPQKGEQHYEKLVPLLQATQAAQTKVVSLATLENCHWWS